MSFICISCSDAELHRPADYSSEVQVKNDRQVDPALMSSNMRDVRHPGFIWRGRTELTCVIHRDRFNLASSKSSL